MTGNRGRGTAVDGTRSAWTGRKSSSASRSPMGLSP